MQYNKEHCDLSIFPTRTTFDETRYKNKELIPSNNTYVTVDGFFDHIDNRLPHRTAHPLSRVR